MLMAVAMLVAVGLVALVGALLVHGAQERPDYVSPAWRDSHVRDRRDDA